MRVLIAVAGALSLIAAKPVAADPLDAAIARYMAVGHIPGVAVAVVEDGEVATLRRYGLADIEAMKPVTPDTPFQTASASKVFTGVLLMRLAQKGVIGLDDPVTRYLPQAPATWEGITFRRMASHMSGLPERLGQDPSATPLEVARLAMARPLAYAPGTESRYGFTDFVVMTAALEAATGLTFPELLKRELSDPLGLTNTGFDYATDEGAAHKSDLREPALTYAWDGATQQRDAFLYPIHGYAAGGIQSSARDLARLFAAIDGGDFLSAESFRQLTTPAPLVDGRPGGFAIGWSASTYRGEAVYGHSGGPALADILHVPGRKLTIVALANQRRFFPLLAQSIADTLWPAPPERPAVPDHRPTLTGAVRRVLTEAGTGEPDPGAFSAAGAGAREFLRGFGGALVTAVGPVRSIEVLSDERTAQGTRRSYRIRFESRTMVWVARTDAGDRIDELRPAGDTE